MYLEITILKDTDKVKEKLKDVSLFYEEDYFLKDVVFVKVKEPKDLEEVLEFIEFRKEQFAYYMEKENEK